MSTRFKMFQKKIMFSVRKKDPEVQDPLRGVNRNRTGDRGVADLCLTAWL